MSIQGKQDQLRQRKDARSGRRIVLLLSLLTMELGILGGVLFKSWETASADLLMKWRYLLTPAPAMLVNPDVAVLAIDRVTQNKMGRFPAGKWISREAYSCQLSFFDNFLSPAVLAYDIVFQDSVGESSKHTRSLSESPEELSKIINGLTKIIKDPRESMDETILSAMNTFALEQGTINMAHHLASISENKRFQPVIGYFFRAKPRNSREGKLPEWSDAEIHGKDPAGDETKGAVIPYLLDVAIPPGDLHLDRGNKYDFWGSATLPSAELLDYALLGYLNAEPDEDGIMRRVPLVLGFKYYNSVTHAEKKVFVPSLALIAVILHAGLDFPLKPKEVEVFLGREVVVHSRKNGDIRIPIDNTGRMYLNFTAKFNDFKAVSFATLAPSSAEASRETMSRRAQEHRGHINGRIIITGVNATGIDIGPCPIESPSPLMIVHLTAINNILNREFLAPLDWTGRVVLWICLAAVFSTVCCLEKTSRLGIDAVLASLFYLTVAFVCVYRSWQVLPVIGPLIYIGSCTLAVLSYRFIAEEKARRRIRQMFSTMVSDQVLSYLEENPDSFSLKGNNVEATVFFSDIVSFTSISERLLPERLSELLNLYLTPATDLILEHGGYVDKYMGDGIMAVWGAPYPDSVHAVNACLSALRQQEMLAGLNLRLKQEFDLELSVRMGINSGQVKAGNMGSERKFQYTVIGDAVNLASRLEPANKDFGTRIIAGEDTNKMISGRIVTRRLGRIVVVGKENSIPIYEVVGEEGKVDSKQLEIIARYESALDCFLRRSWRDCIAELESVLKLENDGPSIQLKRRAEQYLVDPPDSSWGGEHIRSSK